MVFTRRVVAGLVSIAAVVGLNVATAGPAAAVGYGSWINYRNTNPITSSASTWACGSTEQIDTLVGAQTCAIRSPNGKYVQAAIIVRNNKATSYAVPLGKVSLKTPNAVLNLWNCTQVTATANSWLVCFGDTLTHQGTVRSAGIVDLDELTQSPWI